jgi:hypothetical protein
MDVEIRINSAKKLMQPSIFIKVLIQTICTVVQESKKTVALFRFSHAPNHLGENF